MRHPTPKGSGVYTPVDPCPLRGPSPHDYTSRSLVYQTFQSQLSLSFWLKNVGQKVYRRRKFTVNLTKFTSSSTTSRQIWPLRSSIWRQVCWRWQTRRRRRPRLAGSVPVVSLGVQVASNGRTSSLRRSLWAVKKGAIFGSHFRESSSFFWRQVTAQNRADKITARFCVKLTQ